MVDSTNDIIKIGLAIEAPVTVLEREARAKHTTWLNDPTEANKMAFAQALRYWAKETKNKKALIYSRVLETW